MAPGRHADVRRAVLGRLPEFFKNEAELRELWSVPDTRAQLLRGLEEQGFGAEQLAEMQRIIAAENSDLFDVLAHVAYALPPLTREERAALAKVQITAHITSNQQVFLDFVLSCYVRDGVAELDPAKLTPHGPLYHVTATSVMRLGISSLATPPSPVLTHYALNAFGYISEKIVEL